MDILQIYTLTLVIGGHILLSIWAILKVISSSLDSVCKTIWVLIISCFPIIGVIIYIFTGRKI